MPSEEHDREHPRSPVPTRCEDGRLAVVRRLALATLVVTIVLVGVGGYTRGSGSGYGCQDRWPLCEDGSLGGLLPRLELTMVIEWSHRWVAGIVGVLALATAVMAWRRARDRPDVLWPATAGVVAIGLQAWVGRMVVTQGLDADLVSVHLAISMAVVALTTLTAVTSGPAPPAGVPRDRRWTLEVIVVAAGAYALLLLGSYVHNRYFAGWPLMEDGVVPDPTDRHRFVHFLHRAAAGFGLVALGWLVFAARHRRVPDAERRLVLGAAACYGLNVFVGLAHVLTEVSSGVIVTGHLVLGALVWCQLVAVATLSARRPATIDDAPPRPATSTRTAPRG